MPCSHCGQPIESGSRFCPKCGVSVQVETATGAADTGTAAAPPYAGQPGGQYSGQSGPHYSAAQPFPSVRPPLRRPRSGRMIGGVCAAFANAYGWNVVLIRILLVVLTPLHLGTGFLAYVVGWIVIPEDPSTVPPQGSY